MREFVPYPRSSLGVEPDGPFASNGLQGILAKKTFTNRVEKWSQMPLRLSRSIFRTLERP